MKSQELPSQWKFRTDTIKTLKTKSSLKTWVKFNSSLDKSLEILIPKKSFLKRLKQHYRFLKKAYYPYKENQYLPHEEFENILNSFRKLKSINIDSSFLASVGERKEFLKILESFLIEGIVTLKKDGEIIPTYQVSGIYSKQKSTLSKKYKPKYFHISKHGYPGNIAFYLLNKKTSFYYIQRVTFGPTWG